MHNLKVQAGGQLSSELFKDHEPRDSDPLPWNWALPSGAWREMRKPTALCSGSSSSNNSSSVWDLVLWSFVHPGIPWDLFPGSAWGPEAAAFLPLGLWESLQCCFCPCLDLLATLHSMEPLDSNNITTRLGFWSSPLPTLLAFFSLKINLLEVKCQQKRTYFL